MPLTPVITPRRLLALALAFALPAIAAALAATPAHAATPPKGAFAYVGNIDDGSRSGVVDRRSFVSGQSKTFRTELDGGDDIAAGDVLGDAFDELVVGDDKSGRIDVHDTSAGTLSSFGTAISPDVTAYQDPDDDLAVGDTNGDGKDEIVVGNTQFGLVIVYSATGDELDRLGGVGFDSGDRMVVGDFVPGSDADEIAVVNNEEEGKVVVFDLDRNRLRTAHTGFDGGSDDVAVGDDTGDLADEVVVANDEQNRIESVDFATDKVHSTGSAYDSDDNLGVGDVTGDGRAEVLIANTEDNRVDVINFFGPGGTFGSAYDSDDEFVVGTFGSGDLDGDRIPDRVELLGMRDGEGDLVFNLKARGASPCRKDVVVEVDHMTGHAPEQPALDNAVDTFDDAEEVEPVAGCPYDGASAETGINLIVDETDPADQEEIALESPLAPKRLEELIDDHKTLDAPFVRYSLWVDDYVTGTDDDGDPISPAGQAGRGDHDLDFVVALDGKTNVAPTAGLHEATFLHELGHSLGLDHGGETDDLMNCKPNYLSVMNYAFRDGIPTPGPGIVIDFSHTALPTIDEAALDEKAGIGGTDEFETWWTNGLGDIETAQADRRTDWDGVDSNGNGIENDDNGDPDGTGVEADVNVKDPLDPNEALPCELENGLQEGLDELDGHDDWTFLSAGLAGPGSVEPSDSEPTVEQMVAGFEGMDQLVSPDKTVQLRPQKPGFTASVLDVELDADHIYATHNYREEATGKLESTLVVLDRETMAVQSVIPVGVDARAVAVNPLTSRAYVVNRGTGTGSSLSVIDTATRTEIKKVPLGQVAVDVEVNTKLNRAYVSNPTQEDIQILDGATNALLPPVQVGKGLVGMAVDEATGIVHVAMTHRSSTPNFTALGRVRDTGGTQTVLPQIDLGDPGLQAQDVALDPVRDRIYIGGLGGGNVAPGVTVLDQATLQQVARVTTPGPVRAIDANPHTGAVTVGGDRGVELLDASGLKITRHMDVGLVFSVAADNGSSRRLYAGDLRAGTLRRLSYSSGEPK